eukprot:1026497-Rhodomonas_salina.2
MVPGWPWRFQRARAAPRHRLSLDTCPRLAGVCTRFPLENKPLFLARSCDARPEERCAQSLVVDKRNLNPGPRPHRVTGTQGKRGRCAHLGRR